MRCVLVLGPSQAGKSTLVAGLAALDGKAEATEVADHLTLTRFSFMGDRWCAVELAGGADGAGLAGPALMAADIAVLVVPPDPDAAVLSAPYLRAIEASGTPCAIFVNRMDAPAGRVRDIVAALQGWSGHAIVLRQVPMREGDRVVGAVDLISERAWRYREGQTSTLVEIPRDLRDREAEARTALLEHMSDFDEGLLEELIEDSAPASDALFAIAARELAETVLVPVFLGAAAHRNGMQRLMKALRHETPAVDRLAQRLGQDGAVPAAVAFHARMRKHLGKVSFLRALVPGLATGQRLGGGNIGGLAGIGGGAAPDPVEAGDVLVAVKSDHLGVGQALMPDAPLPRPAWADPPAPMLSRMIAPASDRDDVRLSSALARLSETDPALRVGAAEEGGQPVLHVQGPMHLRRVLAQLADDFGLTVTDAPVGASYREAILSRVDHAYRHRKQTGGAGQFADVALTVAPRGRGEGFAFDETVKGGAVPRNYFDAVEAGARDALARGPLGFPVVDVGVTLTDGKHHAVDSSDHAFRTAARQGVKEALEKAGPVLLQPVQRIEVSLPSVFSGALIPLFATLKGQVIGFDADPAQRGWDVFRALLPEAALEDLHRALGAATQGTARFGAAFDHYEELYGREADTISKGRLAAAG
ncbi:MAG TPA: elongation factor G [Paracoccaceae bacterium]|nr:elongation factor G [Paracoccaceae bacterium]HMO70161.1 elongation factor G [Paracoccaceae bacterium]